MNHHMLPLRTFLICGLLLAASAQAASISGKVTATDGKPIRAALSIHDLSTMRTKGSKAFDTQFASKSDGTFLLAGVPVGTYEICVEAPHEEILDPCVWSAAPQFKVAATDVTGMAISVQRGRLTQIQVNDPSAILPAAKPQAAAGHFSITVQTPASQGPARFHSFRFLASTTTGQAHYAVLPFNVPVTVTVSSSEFAVKDDQNKLAANGVLRIPVFLRPTTAAKPIAVTLTKK